MVRPHYIRDLDDYLRWIDQLLDWSGGVLENPHFLHVQETSATGLPGGIEERAALIDDQELRFADGRRLIFRMLIVEAIDAETLAPEDVELSAYKFQFMDEQDRLVWRYENHEGHEDEEGRPTHRHLPGFEPETCDDVDLDDVLKRIYG